MLRTRRCDICGSPLSGKKGHGFVVDNGRMVVCSDFRRHRRMKKGVKYSYGEEAREEEGKEVLNV